MHLDAFTTEASFHLATMSHHFPPTLQKINSERAYPKRRNVRLKERSLYLQVPTLLHFPISNSKTFCNQISLKSWFPNRPTSQPFFRLGEFSQHRPWPDPTRRPKKTGSSLGQPGRHVVKSFIIGDQHRPELRGLQGHELSGISRFFFLQTHDLRHVFKK